MPPTKTHEERAAERIVMTDPINLRTRPISRRIVRGPVGRAGRVQAAARFNPDLHPRDTEGKFRTTLDKVVFGLRQWAANGGKGKPFEGFQREQLRRAGTQLGLTFRPRAPEKEIHDSLLAALRDRLAGDESPSPVKKAAKKAAPKKATFDAADVAEQVAAQSSEEDVIKLLSADSTLTAAKLRKVADELDIDVPENKRAKTSILLHIAENAMSPDKPKAAKKAAPKAPDKPDLDLHSFDDPEALRDALDLRKVPELKDMLRAEKLPLSGRKRDLVDRLVEHIHGGDKKQAKGTGSDLTGQAALASVPVHVSVGSIGSSTRPEDVRGLDRLTDRQRAAVVEAVDSYRGLGHQGINQHLRTGEPVRGAKTAITGIDRGMAESRLPNDIVTFRTVQTGDFAFGPQSDWPDDLTGREWTDLGYPSTTTERELLAKQDNATVAMRVKVPAGTSAMKLSDFEAEVLLDRGLTFRVVADHGPTEISDGFGRSHRFDRYLDVEVVPAPKKATAPKKDTRPFPAGGESMTEDQARARQADMDARRPAAEVLSDVHELVHNGASPRVLKHRIASGAAVSGLSDEDRDRLVAAVDAGNLDEVTKDLAKKAGLTQLGEPGAVVKFDRTKHSPLGKLNDGDDVLVMSPGYTMTLSNGETVTAMRPKVIEADAPKAPAAKKAAPGRPAAAPTPVHDLFKADTPDATIEAALRDVFEGNFGPYTTKVQVKVTRAGTDKRGQTVEPRISVEGKIYDEQGGEIGNFSRSISPVEMHYADGTVRREVWAQHEIVQLGGGDYDTDPTKYHGTGFGGEFNRRAIEWYRASGVHGIGQSDHNGYVWASQGFNFGQGGRVPDYLADNMRTLISDLRAGKTTSEATKDVYHTIPKQVRDAPDLDAQIVAAEELLARAESLKPGDPDYPTAYEISQLGRREGQRGKTSLWFGKLLYVSADEMILNPDEGEVISS